MIIKKLQNLIQKTSWQSKLILSCSSAIFFTFTLFSLLEYNSVSKWMLKREEQVVNRTLTDISSYYKGRRKSDIKNSAEFLRRMNDKDQLIRIYDQSGKVLVFDKNGIFPSLEPAPANVKSMEQGTEEERETIIARYPLNLDHFQGTIEIVRELNSYKKMMDHLSVVMSIFGVAAILLSALSGFFLAKQLLRPIRDLSAAMKKIKENGFQERMEGYKQKDELTDLSNLFNDMMDEIEQSFIQQKQFVEDASHELRTPVSVLEGHLSLLNRWGKKDPTILEESLQASLQEVTRLKKLMVDLLELTKAENLKGPFLLEGIYIEPVLEQAVKNIELLHPDFQIELIIEKLLKPVRITEQHLQQILIILLDNAVKYSGMNKKIVIEANSFVQETIITVEDFGVGIPIQNVEDIFNRFYRVDKARSSETRGTGLGLSIAKRLIEKYKGNITVESVDKKGTKVKVVFPD